MIGLVLVTHGRLAEELRAAMEHVVGAQRSVATMCINAEEDLEHCRARLGDCIAQVDQGDGVVLLTDMFGGTPSNLAISMMSREGVEVIGGVNLPMLVKLAKVRSSQTLMECVDCAEAAGRKYIAAASHIPGHAPGQPLQGAVPASSTLRATAPPDGSGSSNAVPQHVGLQDGTSCDTGAGQAAPNGADVPLPRAARA